MFMGTSLSQQGPDPLKNFGVIYSKQEFQHSYWLYQLNIANENACHWKSYELSSQVNISKPIK